MNLTKTWLLSVCCTAMGLFSYAQEEKYSEVKILTPDESARSRAINSFGLDHFKSEKGSITAVLNSSELQSLRLSGMSFSVTIDDVVQHTIEVNKNTVPAPEETNIAPFQSTSCQRVGDFITTPASFGTGGSLRLGASAGNSGYFTYAEMLAEMNALKAAYPTLVTSVNLGNSANGTAIMGVKISDNSGTDEDEPEVLYTGLQHAREAIGGTSLVFFMEYLCENYAGNARVKELVDSREIFIVPCLNPDGYAYNYSGASSSYPTTGGGLWRKSRRDVGGALGVDLNRNYGVDWGNCSGASSSCGSNVKSQETYYGPSAFSEPETQALRTFVYNHHFVNAIDQHCYGPYYSLPYGRPSLHPVLNHVDSSYYKFIPALMGFYNGHRAGNSPETVNYEVAGGIKDWLLMGDIGAGTFPKTKIYGMTGEAGGNDFWAPVAQIIQLCKENCFQNLQIAYAAGDYYDIQDKSDIALTSLTGNLAFSVRRVGLKSSTVTVSLVMEQNMQTVGAPVTFTIPNYYDTYDGQISYTLPPNFAGGQKIKYQWKVEADGITILDDVTKIYNPLTLMQDDMEGTFATNWNATISPTGPTGWGYTSTSAYGGTKSMTESPTGNYTVSSTRIATYKNTFNLADATSAYISFFTKHRAENFRDKLQVQIATNGSNWTPVCGSNMVSELNTTNGGSLGGQPALTGIRDQWTRELVDLSSFLGQGSVSLRFVFTSDADGSAFDFELDDGFYIDNLKVVKAANITTLAVKFLNFNAHMLANNTVQLDWEAYTDQDHDYFEVEKATSNAGPFVSIAKVQTLPPYKAFDLTPTQGSNFYRIKQVDKDGKFSYSRVITINYNNGKTATIIYPNPVKDVLSVRVVNSLRKDEVTLRLTNASGQVVKQQQASIKAGETEIKMNVSALPAQVYFLKIFNSNNETISIEKIIKQ